jgi:cell wall assembly regulator SMI1
METRLRRFADLLGRALPQAAAQFAPLDSSRIAGFELELGVRLPQTFRQYLEGFGDRRNALQESPRIIGRFCFLSLDEIQSNRNLFLNLFEDEPSIDFIRENKVQPVIWDYLWVPFVDTLGLGNNQFILDLHPGKNGTMGQIIRMYPGIDLEGEGIAVCPGFDEFLDRTCDFLSSPSCAYRGDSLDPSGWFT